MEFVIKNRKVFISGGAGYVGSELVKSLYSKGYSVVVYDLFWFSNPEIFSELSDRVTIVKSDIRNIEMVRNSLKGCTDFIHLACVSNDPSYDLNSELSKSINYDCFEDLVRSAKNEGISRFIFASSSSVYGVKDEDYVTEDLVLEPLTDYSKYKGLCEKVLSKYSDDNFVTVSIRPATVCGYSMRLRLDVVVNILTNYAMSKGFIKVFGGDQKRPNLNILDMVRCYELLLNADKKLINNEVFNVGGENHTVREIAQIVAKEAGIDKVIIEESDDNRSYHISSKKIKNVLGFSAKYSVQDAVRSLIEKFKNGDIKNSFENDSYYNVKYIKRNGLDENSN